MKSYHLAAYLLILAAVSFAPVSRANAASLAAAQESVKTVAVTPVELSSCQVTIPSQRHTYNGSAQKPAVTVTHGAQTLKEGTDYTVTYRNNVNAGNAQIVVTAVPGNAGGYRGTAMKQFHIYKPVAQISSHGDFERVRYGSGVRLNAVVTSGYQAGDKGTISYRSDRKKTATVSRDGLVTIREPGTAHITITVQKTKNYRKTSKVITVLVRPPKTQFTNLRAIITKGITLWWKPRSGVTGYEIRYSQKQSMKKAKLCHVKGAGVVSKTLRGMRAGRRYFIQVRTYQVVGGKHYHSRWSRIRTCVPIIRRHGY